MSKFIIVLLVFSMVTTELIAEDVNLKPAKLKSAKLVNHNKIQISLTEKKDNLKKLDFHIFPALSIKKLETTNGKILLTTDTIDFTRTYFLEYGNIRKEIQPDKYLNLFYSEKDLGCTWTDHQTIFRIFSPRASSVTLVMFITITDEPGSEYKMVKDKDGVWECVLPGHYFGQFYAYKIDGPTGPTELFDASRLIADPYSRAVATKNEFLHRGKTLILNTDDYDWQGDTWLKHDWEDLIIYECHVKGLTAHPSSGVNNNLAGTYKGLVKKDVRGGIEHIKSLGVNAVEFLPIHEFGNIEIPVGIPVNGTTNTWNLYERNYWGYMTSYFFAPESYYATGNSLKPGDISGINGNQVNEFKDVVKEFHKAGIAVIMDVVYNHVSEYDQNCFKLTDKKYYFQLDEDQKFRTTSGCGNDFKSERPMARRLILDSVKYWMTEYHIDGFRFDLATILDWKTIAMIIKEAKAINPDVIIIAEPWGGGKYDPAKFSRYGWAAWNDQFRNAIKGQNPENGQGFIFGKYWDFNNIDTIKRYICGNLVQDGGIFRQPDHSVNYLASHDDHTFGDFIRIGNGDVKPDEIIKDITQNATLTPRQIKLNKLGALLLFTSQGPVMMAEGQEYARSKVIAKTAFNSKIAGRIDHNSYNKDDETNYLNFEHADLNIKLVNYYKGLIALRKKHPAFKKSPKKAIRFIYGDNPFALGFKIDKTYSHDSHDFLVLVNASNEYEAHFKLPKGPWSVVVDENNSGNTVLGNITKNRITLSPTTGMVLMK